MVMVSSPQPRVSSSSPLEAVPAQPLLKGGEKKVDSQNGGLQTHLTHLIYKLNLNCA